MSDLHKSLGHFSQTIERLMVRLYKSCPICGGNIATDYAGHTDHIVPLYLFEKQGELAASLLVEPCEGMHGVWNAWRICNRCHARKNYKENSALTWQEYVTLAKKYQKKAFTFHRDGRVSRKFKKVSQVKKVPRLNKRLRLRRERKAA